LGFVLKFGHISSCHYHGFVHFVEKGFRDTSIQVRFSIRVATNVRDVQSIGYVRMTFGTAR